MQDIIVALILIVMIGAAARYIYKAKKSGAKCIGCSAAGCCTSKKQKKEPSYTVTPEIEAAFPYVYKIRVEGMTCANCAKNVEQAFFGGGYLCRVDLKAAMAEVKSRQPVDEDRLGQIVTDAGYVYIGE